MTHGKIVSQIAVRMSGPRANKAENAMGAEVTISINKREN